MANYSKKVMGKEVGDAKVYAEPHTMSGKKVGGTLPQTSGADYMKDMNISIGNISKSVGKGVKTDGIETRGNGAATKGRIARGPMA